MNAETHQAALIVADRASSADDCRTLLEMLGLKPQSKRRRGGRPPVDHGHGDHRTYNKGCRCDDCREAQRLRGIKQRAGWAQDPSAADRAGHGKPSTYKNYKCRCEPCSKANSADVAAFRARRRQSAAMAETRGAA
ncbi:hypothetical protein [Streptomyces scopuliridis]|uniref:Uncharacterized protein n=1 Tax=Streptomyces scopuliridis RB72 TaxID=1440053 RepID=A0A2T7SP75_9ACTN|nr:hypothetical protein [Streptomyces scopuliridis]PVE04636.1 hypothetical protein Y717_10600 [Streptomyces scopuliridis RB72]